MRIYTMLTGLMETNCYLVVTKERHIAVIDPGADPERPSLPSWRIWGRNPR